MSEYLTHVNFLAWLPAPTFLEFIGAYQEPDIDYEKFNQLAEGKL